MIDKSLLIDSLKSRIKWNRESYNKFKIPAHIHAEITLEHFLYEIEDGKFDAKESKDDR